MISKVTFSVVIERLRNQIFSLYSTTFLKDGIHVKGKQKQLFSKRMKVLCLISIFQYLFDSNISQATMFCVHFYVELKSS